MFQTYFLDSNILIGFLNGDRKIVDWILNQKSSGGSLYISFITAIEVLSLKTLKDAEVESVEKFLTSFHQILINDEIVTLSSALRRKSILTLGDAIITATAISRKFVFVTNDKLLTKKVNKFLEVVSI